MKLVKNASGKTTIKMSKSEWANIGKKAGWLGKTAKSVVYTPEMIRSSNSPESLAEAYQDAIGQTDEMYRNAMFNALKNNPNTPSDILQKIR